MRDAGLGAVMSFVASKVPGLGQFLLMKQLYEQIQETRAALLANPSGDLAGCTMAKALARKAGARIGGMILGAVVKTAVDKWKARKGQSSGGGGSKDAPREMRVGDAGHHVPAVRKSRGRPFEVERSDLTRPTLHVRGDDTAKAQAHWRMHHAERDHVGPRQGEFPGTDKELFEAYRRSYSGLTDIRVDVRSPDGTHVLGENVSLVEAVDLMEQFLTKK
jgi:hypothetical protein